MTETRLSIRAPTEHLLYMLNTVKPDEDDTFSKHLLITCRTIYKS